LTQFAEAAQVSLGVDSVDTVLQTLSEPGPSVSRDDVSHALESLTAAAGSAADQFASSVPGAHSVSAALVAEAVKGGLASVAEQVADLPPSVQATVLIASAIAGVGLGVVTGSGAGRAVDALPKEFDPVAIAAYFERRPQRRLSRQAELARQATWFSTALLSDWATNSWEKNMPLRASQLRELIVQNGAAFIKVGQALAIRPDVLPEPYMVEFAKLLDQVPPFAAVEAQAALRASLAAQGAPPPEEIFESMSAFDTPVAAASIGQVYRARLKPGKVNGVTEPVTVAVKLQRPDILDAVSLDLYIIRRSVQALAALPAAGTTRMARIARSAQAFVEVLDTAATRFLEELRYDVEADNSEAFAALMTASPSVRDVIKTPKVFRTFSSGSVLVQEWVDGVRLSDIPRDTEEGKVQQGKVVRSLLLAYMVQLLETGLLHADPHPGNFLLMPDGRLCILDYGMMTTISEDQRMAFLEYMSHLSSRQFDKTVEDLINLGFVPPELGADPAKRAIVAPAIASTLEILYGSGGGMSTQKVEALRQQSRIAALSEELKAISRQYPVRLPPYFVLILRAFGTLEGLGLGVDGSFAILDECFPFVARRLLTDDSPRVRAALRTFAYGTGDRLSVERVEMIATGMRTFGATMDNTSRAALPPPAGAPAAVAAARPAATLDASTREVLAVLFSPKGNYVQTLLLEEAVRAVDALSREALFALWTAVVQSAPATARVRALLGPASLMIPGMPLFALASSGAPPPVRLSQEDTDTLATLRKLAEVLLPLPAGAPLGAASLQMDVRSIITTAQQLQPLMPTIAPGVASMGQRFLLMMVQRMLVRTAQDLQDVAAVVGGSAAGGGARA
jgi:aarF domain-containing kinase